MNDRACAREDRWEKSHQEELKNDIRTCSATAPERSGVSDGRLAMSRAQGIKREFLCAQVSGRGEGREDGSEVEDEMDGARTGLRRSSGAF